MTLFTLLPPNLTDVLGLAGFALYVLNYTALTLRLVSGDALAYFTVNLIAAALVLIGLTASFNLASAMIQMFWIAVSIVGIALRLITLDRPA